MNWSRNSREAKLVKAKGKEYLEKVKAAVNLELDAKAEKKKRKIKKALDLLAELKKNKGPVTSDDIDRLNTMSTEELLDQITYLRYTIAPNIRQKRKVGNKFEQLSDDELRLQITDVLKPMENIADDMNELIVNALSAEPENSENVLPTIPDDSNIGKIGIWKGSFDRQCVAVQITTEKVQLFRKMKRGYYKLSDLPENKDEWELQECIPESDYEYVEQQGQILLKLIH